MDYATALRSSTKRIAGSGYEIDYLHAIFLIYHRAQRKAKFQPKVAQTRLKFRLYRYVTRTNVSFFDPSPNDQRTEHSCA